MRKLNTNHWTDTNALEGLLFFSQSVDEMLFDYTLDSYKPSALNSHLLCLECLTQITEVKNGFIQKKNLQSIVDELKFSLNADLAAKSILGAKLEFYISQLNSAVNNLEKLKILVSFFLNQFDKKKYLEKIKQQLTIYIQSGKNKTKIRSLTNSLLTELINYGYHPNNIYYQNSNYFFNSSKKATISSVSEISEFLNLFNFEKKEFTVVFIGGIIFRNFRDTLNTYNIVVTRTYNCFSKMQDDISFRDSRKEDESYIICSKVEAYDHHSAREAAEKFLGQVTGLFNFYHHKERAEILDKSVVSRVSDNYVVVLDKPTKSILKIKTDMLPRDAADEVKNTISGLGLRPASTYRFSRCIDLHSAALSASAIENQLLDLWAAIETLIPKSFESNQDRIIQICNSLIPFLQLNYFQKQLLELLNDIRLWDEEKANTAISKIPDATDYSELEKIAALVSLDTCLSIREELYSQMQNFPLLKNRIYSLHQNILSPESIKKALDFHKLKSEWHIKRIYRTRGHIIHSGKYPSYTSILIENLHTYFDTFVRKLIALSVDKKIDTIDQGILEVQMVVEYQYSLLIKHQKEPLTKDNFKEALLGKENNNSA